MKLHDKDVLVCDCFATMPLDGEKLAKACGAGGAKDGGAADGGGRVNRMLCRDQIARLTDAARENAEAGREMVVACTQEHAAFREALEDAGIDVGLRLVNIRENAGWSKEADKATPKIAALLADATLNAPDVPTVEMESSGICLVYGAGEVALEAARRLDDRMTVSLLLTDLGDLTPLGMMDILASTGRIAAARGHLGDFEVNVDGYAPIGPASREGFDIGRMANGAAAKCDVILDLSGRAPLFPSHERRDGYFRVDPGDPVAVQKAIFDASDMLGTFEKPRYVAFHKDLCAHSRSQVTGCTRCLDACPAAAITPDGDAVAIDPYLCGGCGACNSVCPTEAAAYAYPPDRFLLTRIRMLLSTYAGAGGKRPVLFIHDEAHGTPLIEAMARFGRGLPARAIPFQVNEATQVNAELLVSAIAYGAERVIVHVPAKRRDELDALAQQIGLAETVLSGLGTDSGRASVLVEDDPDAVEAALYDLPKLTVAAGKAADFHPQSEKRANMRLAAWHLAEQAENPPEYISLPRGSAYGRVDVDVAGCTLCLACVSTCPTGALSDNPSMPQLTFQESSCIQCGLCRNTCPEKVITLEPRFTFGENANAREVVKEEEPFECVSCGKPFAAKSTIEKMVEQLGGKHWMFEGKGAERLKMCEDCRVQAVFNEEPHLASGQRPTPRTTDDYLQNRIKDEEEAE